MFGYLRTFVEAFYPSQFVRSEMSFADRLASRKVIETTNDCGEKRYIEMPRNLCEERKANLEVLLTKCKRLLSFVTTRKYMNDHYIDVLKMHDRICAAFDNDDDILPLVDEFDEMQHCIKKSSRSFRDLSSTRML